MKIAIWLSSKGGSPLQVGLERGLRQLGHHVSYYQHGQGYDLVLILNQVAHTTDYVYPAFPPANIPIAFVDAAEMGYMRRGPEIIRNYANFCSPGSMTHDTKNPIEQRKLRTFLEGRSFPYFIREFSKWIEWPRAYHMVDYPIYALSECHQRPERDEYLRRPDDIFVSWGASHPFRLPITEALRAAKVKGEIHVLEQNGAVRLPQKYYFDRTRGAKCSVSADGYGSSSFRLTEVLVRCLLLQGPLQIHMRAPLVDRETCREYRIVSNGMEFISTDIGDVLREALADPVGSYEIYARGYDHCVTHYTEKAVSRYVLDVVSKHDWSKPTQLDIPL